MLHHYSICQSYRMKPIYDIETYDIETIRSYLVLANLIMYLSTKNDNPDKSWSVPKGWEM